MTYLKCAALVMIVLLVVGCGTKDPLQPTTATKTDIMPLKIGNQWTYDLEAYYAPNQPPSEYYVYYITVTDTVSINSEKWYTTTISIPSEGYLFTIYYINRSDGLYFRTSTAANDSVYLRFKYPTHVGDTCHVNHEFFRLWWGYFNSFPAEINSTGVTVQVPYDTLTCLQQYAETDPGYVNSAYIDDCFRPDLGMMRSYYMVYYDATYGYYPYLTWELTAVSLQ